MGRYFNPRIDLEIRVLAVNIHDWQRENREGLDAFNEFFDREMVVRVSQAERSAMLRGWLACWSIFKPPPISQQPHGLRVPGKAWNGKPRCGLPIKQMHYHRTPADAVCDLPKMDGSDLCWRHTKKAQQEAKNGLR